LDLRRYAVVPVLMLASIGTWLATCWSDPGAVHAGNLAAHLQAYPFDGVMYTPKECPTLGRANPPHACFFHLKL